MRFSWKKLQQFKELPIIGGAVAMTQMKAKALKLIFFMENIQNEFITKSKLEETQKIFIN